MPLNKDNVTAIFRDRIDQADGFVRGLLEKEYTAERSRRPDAHNHENELPARPVLSFDLHRTLTPDFGFPLLSAPYPGVKAFLDRMVARNCCIHIVTASLDRADPQIVSVRKQMIQSWATAFGLPIGWIGPNVDANVRVDDRGVAIPENPDWDSIGRQAEKKLLAGGVWTLDPDTNLYTKNWSNSPVGEEVTRYPEITEAPDDAPRGWSSPLLDLDIHRTLNPGWGSTREQAPLPDGVRAVQRWYDQGYQIQMSCAGWMRSTHTQAQSEQRLALFRLYFHRYGIPYDRIVTKDDCDIWFDDKTVPFTTWKQTAPLVDAALLAATMVHPAYSLPQTYSRSESSSAELDELRVEVKKLQEQLRETPSAKSSPEIHVHFPEGMIQAPLNIADGAIRAESHFAAPGQDTEFTYDGEGRVARVRRK